MLKIINESLFSFYSEDCNNKTYGNFSKISIQSSRYITRLSEETHEFTPNVRIFARLISSDKDHTKFNLAYSTKTENDKVQLLLKSSPEVEKDSLIYLIAFPFNGIIKPIPESSNYRILKGMISVSDQYSVMYNNKRYKKILYLAVSPRVAALNSNTEQEVYIPFNIESYAYYKDKEGNSTTVRETLALRIKKDNEYNAKFITEEIEPVNIDEYRNQPIFTVYKKSDRNESSNSVSNIHTVNKNTNSISTGGYSKPTFQDRNNFAKDNDEDMPKKKTGGNPNRKKKAKR